MGSFSVSCKFKSVVDQFGWAFAGVYGPNSVRDRRLLREELFGLRNWWNIPWCVGGDFNVVRFPSECTGSTVFIAAMHDFSDFISREVELKAQLDRFLFFADWEAKFPTVCQRRMSRLLLDHFPIVLEGGSFQHRGRSPFRFENMRLKDEGFVDKVSS